MANPFFAFRKTSNQIVGASIASRSGELDRYHDEFQPATAPDGLDMATPKIRDGTALRNATAGEIAGFGAFETADNTAGRRAALKRRVTRDTSIDSMLQTIATSSGTPISTVRTTYASAVDTN